MIYEEEHDQGYADHWRTVRLHRHSVRNERHLIFRRIMNMKMMKNLTKSMQTYGEMLNVIGG